MTTNAQLFWFTVWLTCVIVVEWIARRRMRRIEKSNAANMISNAERNVAAAAVVASNASVVAVMNENALLMTELLRVEKFSGRTGFSKQGRDRLDGHLLPNLRRLASARRAEHGRGVEVPLVPDDHL